MPKTTLFPKMLLVGAICVAVGTGCEKERLRAEPDDGATHEITQFRTDLKEFSAASATLPAREAAERWVGFVDRLGESREGLFRRATRPVSANEVLEVLPPPAAWPEIARIAADRPSTGGALGMRSQGLRWLGMSLTGDAAGRRREITAICEMANKRSVRLDSDVFEQIVKILLMDENDPEAAMKVLEQQVKASQKEEFERVQIPNLVAYVGVERAETFLRHALAQPVSLDFDQPNDTTRLAQKVAMDMIDQLGKPQWILINSLDAVELYEAMEKKFSDKSKKSPSLLSRLASAAGVDVGFDFGEHDTADLYYIMGLIARNRTSDAVAVAKRFGSKEHSYLPDEAFDAMERAGYTVELDSFFHQLLSQDAGLPFWDRYVRLAARAGKTERMLELVRAAAAQKNLNKKKRAVIQTTLFKALLAADHVNEGVEEIKRLIALGESSTDSAGELWIRLARLGMLTRNDEWTKEGIDGAWQWLKGSGSESQWEVKFVINGLTEVLSGLKRDAEVEVTLKDIIAREAKISRKGYDFGGETVAGSALIHLAELYHREGRHKEVLDLFDQATQWGVEDLKDIEVEDSSLPPLYLAASSLIALGREPEARVLVEALIDQSPGSDRGYELLLRLGGERTLARLDELFARDQFQERPLIWKAVRLQNDGKLEEAEKAIRQAISVDPSDGEEGRGDRMRAYAILADLREAQGDTNETAVFRGAVSAIRLSEEADKFREAGLLKRAVDMYEEALQHFADAYCIQSRLAIQLTALGRLQEAEVHYRRAYELMPDSFGRVESHCFGCEHAFDGERAQSIAETVFTKFVAERPDKPQVHYLLGYLREEQRRYDEARKSYREAVRLDPKYLNAWIHINRLGEHMIVPAAERDQIALTIIHLDPLLRHGHVDFEQIGDLTGLWDAMAANQKYVAPKKDSLYSLAASKAELEKNKSRSSLDSYDHYYVEWMESKNRGMSPSEAVSRTLPLKLAGQLFTAAD